MKSRDFSARQFDRAVLSLPSVRRRKRSPLRFVLLVFALSLPFWLIGAMAESSSEGLPIDLPASSLVAFCPLVAASILVRREDKPGGLRELLKRVFDHGRVGRKIWYAPAVLLMPVVMLLSYGVMRLMGSPLPEPHIPFLAVPILFVVFFVAAAGEEVGWTGYAVDPMQDRWNALSAGIVLGLVWAMWHLVPYVQAHHTPTWIVWQCLCTVAARILIVWLYNNAGKSVFAAILLHATSNVGVFLFPNYGSHYDPAITGVVVAITAAIVTFLWGSQTLARYRYKSRRE